MKNIFFIMILFLTINIQAQYYTTNDFLLNGKVNRASVICYGITIEEDLPVESFPYSTQIKYKTDLNLHYLEFNIEGQLIRSKLYYPRDFYGQFSWLKPVFNLEASDFGEKINYLTQLNRYKYFTLEDSKLSVLITSENGTEVNLILDEDLNLKEDEYYTYLETKDETKTILTKRRKDSAYGYRRIEIYNNSESDIEEEYINNRFLVSKKSLVTNENYKESIFVSQSRIMLQKEEYQNNKIMSKLFVNLSWRNKFLKWPEIDFDTTLGYTGFLASLERESDQYEETYKYDKDGNIILKSIYKYNYETPVLIKNTNYKYDDNGLLIEVLINPDPSESKELLYKEYTYDEQKNWVVKTIGKVVRVKNKEVKIPTKKYVKTLTYWN